MHGKVMQWVQDSLPDSYANIPANGTAYEHSISLKTVGNLASMTGNDSCAYRMLRGGAFGRSSENDSICFSQLRSGARSYAGKLAKRRTWFPCSAKPRIDITLRSL